jgi:uncharacterized membrane protein
VLSVLLGTTIVAAVEYYRHVRRARTEYERAKGAVEDIVLSFNRQLRQEAQKLEVVGYQVETIASKNDNALKKAESLEGIVSGIESKILADSEDRARMATRLSEIEQRASNLLSSYEAVLSKVAGLEEQATKLRVSPDASLEGVIPIRRDKAMAQLTETELSVLELLVAEGAKTAPEIKEKVKLSREHTARLMKKLYEEGYLERDTGKIPFRYSVKKEMANLLGKAKSETP